MSNSDTYLEYGAQGPTREDLDEFERDVHAIVTGVYDDCGLEVAVHIGYEGGTYVAVSSIKDSAGAIVEWPTRPAIFYSVDDFERYVDRFTPGDY